MVALEKAHCRSISRGHRMNVVYEVGPRDCVIWLLLERPGIECDVVAALSIPRAPCTCWEATVCGRVRTKLHHGFKVDRFPRGLHEPRSFAKPS